MTDESTESTAPGAGTGREAPHDTGAAAGAWEKDLVNRLAFAALNEQRRSRRWGIFFKALLFAYLLLLLVLAMQSPGVVGGFGAKPHTGLVDLRGVIADDSPANADNVIAGLRAAFEGKDSAGVILRINSPGGSPVQAGYINNAIRRLREEFPEKRLFTVITDVCASGGYFVAVATEAIYADSASIVGSIGVRLDSFGFVDAMEKLGVERRLMTAGENKGFLDPFSPEKEADVRHIQKLLDNIHRQFIEVVKAGRGERLENDDRIFSGLVWTGEQGVELGLVDGIGDVSYVAKELIGAEEIVNYTRRPDWLERFGERFGMALAAGLKALTEPVSRIR